MLDIIRLQAKLIPALQFVFICIFSAIQMFLYVKYTNQIETGCFAATIMTIFKISPYTYYLTSVGIHLFDSQILQLVGFSIVYCVIIREAFEIVNDRMKATITLFHSGQIRDFTISSLVAQHYEITKMVKLYSEMFGLYALLAIFFSILQMCFMMYSVLFMCPNALIQMIVSGALIIGVSLIFLLNLIAVQVHKSVSSLVYTFE